MPTRASEKSTTSSTAGRLAAAVAALRTGRLVVHPTDTLYALGASGLSRTAVDRLLWAKGRAPGRPLSVSVSSVEELERWGVLGRPARRFVRERLPGAYTVLAVPSEEARRRLVSEVGGGARIGLRVPAHPIPRELARQCGPVVATSANLSAGRPTQSLREARAVFGGKVAAYVDGPPRPTGRPSTLIDVSRAEPREVAR